MHDVGQRAGELEEFLYRVSHDLRTPAVAVLGFAEALRHELEPLGGDAALFLDRITANARLIERQLEALLELSRVGRTHTEREPFSLDALARRVAASVEGTWPALTVSVERLPFVVADPFRLEQLLRALLDNAARHNPGRVRAVVRWEPGAAGGGAVVVSDDGQGIPPALRVDAFEVFRRFQPAETAGPLGIGLALVRRIAEHIDGTVTLGAGPGDRGLEVRITLPASVVIDPVPPT